MSVANMDVDDVLYSVRRLSSSHGVPSVNSSAAIASQRSREVRRKVEEQVMRVRGSRRPNDPMVHQQLVPRDMAKSTFSLPAVEQLLREFLPLEEAVNELLAPLVNWAPPGYKPDDSDVHDISARLWALRTDGDGDCLLHAVSLSLWGEHDRSMVLRELVVAVLGDKPSEKLLFQLWREGQLRADAAAGGNASFEMEEEQVVAEWNMLVRAAKTRTAYLSSFHTFVLANVLRRPIVVYGDRFVRGKNGEPYAPSDMLGVYLPTLIQPRLCYKIPLVVGYTCVAVGKVGHFTALVGVEGELQHLPLVDEHGDDLPVRYGVPHSSESGREPSGELMEKYMKTMTYTTQEGQKYIMAMVEDAHITAEAEDIRQGMADEAEAAFERLTKAQEDEINGQLGGSSNGAKVDAPGGKTTTPSLSLASRDEITSPLAPLVLAGTNSTTPPSSAVNAGILDGAPESRCTSPGTDTSDGPTADSFVKSTASPAPDEERKSYPPSQWGANVTATSMRGGAVEGDVGDTDSGELGGRARRKRGELGSSTASPSRQASGTASEDAFHHSSNGVRYDSSVGRYNSDNGDGLGADVPAAASCGDGTSRAARTLLLSSRHLDPADYSSDVNGVRVDGGGSRSRHQRNDDAGNDTAERASDKRDMVRHSDDRGLDKTRRPSSSDNVARNALRGNGALADQQRANARTYTFSALPNGTGEDDRHAAACAKAGPEVKGGGAESSSSLSVSRFFPGRGMLSSSVGVLSSVGAWATRRSSGRLSRESSSSIEGAGDVAGDAGVSGINGRKGADRSSSPSDLANKAGFVLVNGEPTREVVRRSSVNGAASGSPVALRGEKMPCRNGQAGGHSDRESSRGGSGKKTSGDDHPAAGNDRSEEHHCKMTSRPAGVENEETGGTWESDLKLALSMDLVNNGEGARVARNMSMSEDAAADAMDGGSSSGSHKRKPDASPACSPDGPSPTGGQQSQQDFVYPGADSTTMDDDEIRKGKQEARGSQPVSVTAAGAGSGSSRTDKEAGLLWREMGRDADGALPRAERTTGTGPAWHTSSTMDTPPSDGVGDRASKTLAARPTDAIRTSLATERWRGSHRSGSGIGAGSRRGQPHPRGDSGERDEGGSSDYVGGYGAEEKLDPDASSSGSNPWLGGSSGVLSLTDVAATTTAAAVRGSHQQNTKNPSMYGEERDVDGSTEPDDEQSYCSIAGPEFESVWAGTDFGSNVGIGGIKGAHDGKAEVNGRRSSAPGMPSEYHSATRNGDSNTAKVALNDRIQNQNGGESRSCVSNGGSRGADEKRIVAGVRSVALRYPYSTRASLVPGRDGDREFSDAHYKTLEELKRERMLRQQNLDGKGRDSVATRQGGVSSEGTDRYDLPPEPAPIRAQLPLQARRPLGSTAALAAGSHSGGDRHQATPTTTTAYGAAPPQPPTPPRRSLNRRNLESNSERALGALALRSNASATTRRWGYLETASTGPVFSCPTSVMSSSGLYQATRRNFEHRPIGNGNRDSATDYDYYDRHSRDNYDEDVGAIANIWQRERAVPVGQKYIFLDASNSVSPTAVARAPTRVSTSRGVTTPTTSDAGLSFSSRSPIQQSWMAESLRRKLDGAGSGRGGLQRPLSPGQPSRRSSSVTRSAVSARASGASGSRSYSVSGTVARVAGGPGGGSSGSRNLRYEKPTLSSLRKSQPLHQGARGGAGAGPRASGGNKFY